MGVRTWLLAAIVAAALAACGVRAEELGPEPSPAAPSPVGYVPAIVPDQHPAPNLPPAVSIVLPAEVHAGIAAEFTVRGTDPDDLELIGTIDFGDGSARFSFGRGSPAATRAHTYASPGRYTVTAIMRDLRGGTGSATATLDVLPRKVLFVQGYGSESQCPGGGGFASRVDGWARTLLESDGVAVSRPTDILYGSYSGRWCDGGDGANGAYADYRNSETCSGIDDPGGLGERLREQVDAVAPAKVVIVGHSMGGLAAAWLVGSDPDWARDRITAVVTFDSPLRGVPQVNLTLLRIGGDCSFNSRSTQDLSDGNSSLLRVAATAAGIVPFYNLDATRPEGVLFVDIREPVPGGRTHLDGETLHWRLDATHNGIWNSAPRDEVLATVVHAAVACAIEGVERCRLE